MCPSNGPVRWRKIKFLWWLGPFCSGPARTPEAWAAGRDRTGFHPRILLQICQRRVWKERRAWQRADLQTAQCHGQSCGTGKTQVISPAAKAATVRREEDGFFLLLSRVKVHTPETLGFGGWNQRRTRQNPKVKGEKPAPETFPWELVPAAVSAVEGDDSVLVRRPFDAWGNKGWFFTGSGVCSGAPGWMLTSGNATTPRAGPAVDPDSRVWGHESTLQTEATGKEGGQLSGGTLSTHTAQTQSWGVFHNRIPTCCAWDSFVS